MEWFVDEHSVASSTAEDGASLWLPTRGRHVAKARIWLPDADTPRWTHPVDFLVK